jgi:hypothetical protein
MTRRFPPPWTVAISGRASVIDGDTIELHGQRIRLWGIDAIESSQLCQLDGKALALRTGCGFRPRCPPPEPGLRLDIHGIGVFLEICPPNCPTMLTRL